MSEYPIEARKLETGIGNIIAFAANITAHRQQLTLDKLGFLSFAQEQGNNSFCSRLLQI